MFMQLKNKKSIADAAMDFYLIFTHVYFIGDFSATTFPL